jgi:hypothetical protein
MSRTESIVGDSYGAIGFQDKLPGQYAVFGFVLTVKQNRELVQFELDHIGLTIAMHPHGRSRLKVAAHYLQNVPGYIDRTHGGDSDVLIGYMGCFQISELGPWREQLWKHSQAPRRNQL